MPKPTFDFSELSDEALLADVRADRLKVRAATRVRDASEGVKAGVKDRMPVRTGSAKSRWGTPNAWQAPGIFGYGIWDVDDDGLTIEQGAGMPTPVKQDEYIVYLNEGSSSQAPAGFIDVEVEKGKLNLLDGIDKDIDTVMGA
jgi:hypothetical protein